MEGQANSGIAVPVSPLNPFSGSNWFWSPRDLNFGDTNFDTNTHLEEGDREPSDNSIVLDPGSSGAYSGALSPSYRKLGNFYIKK